MDTITKSSTNTQLTKEHFTDAENFTEITVEENISDVADFEAEHTENVPDYTAENTSAGVDVLAENTSANSTSTIDFALGLECTSDEKKQAGCLSGGYCRVEEGTDNTRNVYCV
jgi:hypothetical protein